MTINEFNKTNFSVKSRVKYDGVKYSVGMLNFKESLIGIIRYPNSKDPDITWVRCENCKLLKDKSKNEDK